MLEHRPDQSRIDAPARAGLRRYRLHALAIFVAGMVAFVGFCVGASIRDDRAEDLQHNGLRVPGVVTAACRCSATARYEWNDTMQSVQVRLTSHSHRYRVGEAVVVLIDPDDAGHVTLLGEKDESPTTTLELGVLLVVGSFALVMGTCCLARVRRQRRIVEDHGWVSCPARWIAGTGRRIPVPQLALATEDGRWQRLRIAPITRWRLKASGLRAATSVEVASGETGRAVVRTPRGEVLVSAKRFDASVADDAPAIDPTRPPLSSKQRRNVMRFQMVGLVIFTGLALFSAVDGPTWGTIFYTAMIGVAFAARHAVRARGVPDLSPPPRDDSTPV